MTMDTKCAAKLRYNITSKYVTLPEHPCDRSDGHEGPHRCACCGSLWTGPAAWVTTLPPVWR
jgi:hypothetical protein